MQVFFDDRQFGHTPEFYFRLGVNIPHPAIPNYHTGRRVSRVPNGVIGKLGYYATDTSCPVMRGTWEAIYWSAQCAVDAARCVAAG